MRRILLALCAVVALAAAGCGGNDDNDSSGSGGSTSSATSGSSSSDGVAIKMKGFQFSPKDVTVKVGQTITWTNEDTADHNVTADSGEDFKSKDFGKGGTFEYKADEAGKVAYECTLHPGMKATLTITE
jgi:plastocyanin